MTSNTATRPPAPEKIGGRRSRVDAGRCRGAGSTTLLVLLIVAVAFPLIAVLIRAVTGYNGQPSALGELAEPGNLRILGNTVLLGVMAVIFSTLLAAPLAFLMSWTRMREHRWIDVLVMIPFMTPPYVKVSRDGVRVVGLGDRGPAQPARATQPAQPANAQ